MDHYHVLVTVMSSENPAQASFLITFDRPLMRPAILGSEIQDTVPLSLPLRAARATRSNAMRFCISARNCYPSACASAIDLIYGCDVTITIGACVTDQ